MRLITSHHHQCIAAAFAMVFGYTLDEILKVLGHNGLQRICEDEIPYCYRGFHPTEFVSHCLTKGLSLTMIEKYPSMMHGDTLVDHTMFLGTNRFYRAFDFASGVVLGSLDSGGKLLGHAVAWDVETRNVFDPRGVIYPLSHLHALGFEPRQFFLIQRVCSHEGRESLQE